MDQMTSGQLAARVGVNVETLRYYERSGILPSPPRTRTNRRQFEPETVERLLFFKRAQRLGFSLAEIRELLSLSTDSEADCAEVRAQASTKLEEVEGRIRDLEAIRRVLKAMVDDCPGSGPTSNCTILAALREDSSI
ncbi:MAG: MerR family transcriptional regulator [Planctomycetota bacterium]|nr:MAG: MerR family transcriptional regulator [Planctomycetota bacterium]